MEKIKAGAFDGPQIRNLVKDANFTAKMNFLERTAWVAYRSVVTNFLGNTKAENYPVLVAKFFQRAGMKYECEGSFPSQSP